MIGTSLSSITVPLFRMLGSEHLVKLTEILQLSSLALMPMIRMVDTSIRFTNVALIF